jgi:hypothetical protein
MSLEHNRPAADALELNGVLVVVALLAKPVAKNVTGVADLEM